MMSFFTRKKDKDEMPVVAKKPPVPPKRRNLFSLGSHKSTELPNSSEGPEDRSSASTNGSTEHEAAPRLPPRRRDPLELNYDATDRAFQAHSDADDAAPLLSPSQPHAGAVFATPKDFDLPGLRLPALQAVQVNERTLKLKRGIAGDFGFVLRRVQYPVGGVLRTIIFAEPAEIKSGPPRPDDIKSGLLPGDQLVEIDGRNVDRMSRDELHEAVRQAEQFISLTVRSVPELAEFCDRHRGVRDTGDSLLLTNVDTNAHENIPEDERYWLMHKGGYTLAKLKKHLPDGRVAVTVAGRDMNVDSTDVDRANPSRLDRAPDLSALNFLNETSVVHLLRQRFGSNLSYTNAGSTSLICLSSAQEPEVQERLLTLFKGCRRGQMPPHIYATAQIVYRYVQMTGSPQAVLFTGASGSGKSTQLRSFVHYLASVAGWTKSLPFSKLSNALGIVEAFSQASTQLHQHSTRVVQLFQLGFDKAAALRSGKVQCCLLEADRVIRRPEHEHNFHIFYYLWEGADDALRKRLDLDSIENPAIIPLRDSEERARAAESWNRLLEALKSLDFTQQQIDAMCLVLGAILHLCRADASPGAAQRAQFLRTAHAKTAAQLLGVTENDLVTAVFRQAQGAAGSMTTGSSLSRFSLSSRGPEGPDALASFCAALYTELFAVVADGINRALAVNVPCTHVTLLDLPGNNFNAAWSDSIKRRPSNLNDLVYNYVNERVSELFHDKSFAEMDEIYTREQVDVAVEKPMGSPHPLNRLLDEKQHLVNCTDLDRRSEERRGVLPIIEEESCFPGATDESLLERIFIHLGDQSRLIRRANRARQFVLAHGLDSQPTTYDVSGWVRLAQPSDPSVGLRKMLVSCKNLNVQSLFAPSGVTAADSNLRLRRATQTATTAEASGVLRKRDHGFASNIAYQLDYVFSVVRRSPRAHFVHCIQPTPNGQPSSQMLSVSQASSSESIDVPFVRSQMRSVLLIDSVRANNRGYPERISFRDFRRRFGCLTDEHNATSTSIDEAIDDRAAVQKIMDTMDIHAHRYRLGISQVLLRADVLVELEDRRDLSLSGLIVDFQKECRRHLAAKWLAKRRVLETAIRCIQKNGLNYLKVREWPWWRIYTKVLPLLPLHRVADEHKEWAERVQKLERILVETKKEKHRAEARCAELDEALGRESDALVAVREELERERQHRVQAERKLADEDRISRVSSVPQLESLPAAFEAKERELKQELDRIREEVEIQQVKTQKTVTELAEARAVASETTARNDVLEKKQKRFDDEIAGVRRQLDEALSLKTRVEKERDEVVVGAQRRKKEFDDIKAENVELRTAVNRLKREIDEANERSATTDSTEVTTLRAAKRELEAKVHEQEEDLDDLAGERQQLQQTVTRLEMQLERAKNDMSRDASARDAETEEIRAQYQRRVRAFEDQIADLQDSNAALTKQNRALEARMRNSDAQSVSLEFSGGHYKRELRKALALLADTQAVLAHERENHGGQALIRQLREQLEDAEAAKLAAQKGRHSLESELNELRGQLEQIQAAKTIAEEKVLNLLREKNRLMSSVEDRDEELAQLLKKYKAAVQQTQIDSIAIADYIEQIAELERAKKKLADELADRNSELDHLHQHTVEKHRLLLADQKIRDLELKLELEITIRQKHEATAFRLSDEVENLNEQLAEATANRDKESDVVKRLRKELVIAQEAVEVAKKRETEATHRLKQKKDESDAVEEKLVHAQNEIKIAQKRIETLQSALAEDIGDSDRELSDVEEENEDDQGDDFKARNFDDSASTNGMHVL